MIEEAPDAWEAPFADAFDEDTQSFPFGTNSLYANPDCKAHILPICIVLNLHLSFVFYDSYH